MGNINSSGLLWFLIQEGLGLRAGAGVPAASMAALCAPCIRVRVSRQAPEATGGRGRRFLSGFSHSSWEPLCPRALLMGSPGFSQEVSLAP